jgi:transcriptional regulator of arginine metabolism
MIKDSQALINDLRKLLLSGANTTQEAICNALEERQYSINQSKVSRLLRKINAVKSLNEHGEMVYRLPHDVAPPPIHTTLSDLVLDIVANETTIIIKTSPGSASVIARIIDDKKCQILGTIAGDDAIFVAPLSIKTIDQTLALIRESLSA